MKNLPTSGPPSLAGQIAESTGLDPSKCYQCGKCSAGCPMAVEMPIPPHLIIRLVQLDRRDRVLASESLWYCLTCETCTTRCPNGFDPARMIDGLREIAVREKAGATPRRIGAFHKSFLDQIRSHGRMFEMGLIAFYKMRSRAFFDDVLAAPATLAKGKLGFIPHRIEGLGDVRRIFDACMKIREVE